MMYGSITFRHIDIKKAQKIAKQENKYVFIDTYATWCKPCKQMDKVFQNSEIGQFFNDHFVSVKIDMDSGYGKEVSADYDVVWLPTLIILDAEGNVKNKIDKLVDVAELLDIAKEAIKPGQVYVDQGFSANPFETGGATTTEIKQEALITEENAPIVYVHDERASSGRPHIMYHEAYLHMMLMDGKQYQVAAKYLSTQSDWSTEKNIKFIFDFLHQTKSKEFDYFIRHKDRFVQVVGKEQVDRTLYILCYEQLHNGYPRPSLQESKQLYKHIDPTNADSKAYLYYLNRLWSENKNVEYINVAKQYLTEINPFDHKIMYQYSYTLLKHKRSAVDMGECMKWAQEALIYDDTKPSYHLHLANLYMITKDKYESLQHCEKALALAQAKNIDTSEIQKLRSKLNSL